MRGLYGQIRRCAGGGSDTVYHIGVHLQTSKAGLVTVIGSKLPLLTSGSEIPVSEQ